jgi:hypothetical protein
MRRSTHESGGRWWTGEPIGHPEATGEFDCDPGYVVEVTGDVVARANLDENRI